jgi:membrane protein required for colicin V production
MTLPDWPLLDWITLSIVGLACLRGLWIGLIREGLSLATVGIATIVTRLYVAPVSDWLSAQTGGELTGRTGLWIAGVLLVVGTVAVLSVVGRLLRRSAEVVGLGFADRLGGGALGAAEGAIVASILVVIALWLVGPSHPSTRDARSVALVSKLRAWRESGEPPSVAAPGPWR